MKKRGYLVIGCIVVIIALLVTSYYLGTKHCKKIAVDFCLQKDAEETTTWRYMKLNREVSDYICSLCEGLNYDSDYAVGHLMEENPSFDPMATHTNDNGTVDLGLFQENDRYVWTTFKDRYWFDNVELNPFNWKHNTYIAIHHMKYLQEKFGNMDDAIMAYNCGEGAVMNNTVPSSTYGYLTRVKNNVWLLKHQGVEDGNN